MSYHLAASCAREKQEGARDRTNRLVQSLLQSPEVKQLWDSASKMCGGDRITVESVTKESNRALFGAYCTVYWKHHPRYGFLLRSPKIFYCEALDDDTSKLYILFEICNLTCFTEYLDLDMKVQRGELAMSGYVASNYEIEAGKVNRLYHFCVEKIHEKKIVPRDVYLKPFDGDLADEHKRRIEDSYRNLRARNPPSWLAVLFNCLFYRP